jgi:hypothetical protein
MIVTAPNRFARAMDYPSLAKNSVSLVTDVSAPGSAFQNKSYGLNGLGDVITDITTGNFSALPTDFINGFSTGDIGSYAIAGLILFMVLGSGKGKGFGGKSASRQKSRAARLKGQIAQDSALLS